MAGSTHAVWPMNVRRVVWMMCMSGGWSVHLRSSSFEMRSLTLMLHTITSTHINWFWSFFCKMLLSKYTFEWWFAILPLLTNDLHYVRKKNLRNCLFSYAVWCILKTMVLWLAITSTFINEFLELCVNNKFVLLSTVCKYFFLPIHFCV